MKGSKTRIRQATSMVAMLAILMIIAIGCGAEATPVSQSSGQDQVSGVNVQPTSMPAQNQAPSNVGQMSQQMANRPVVKAPDDIEATDTVNNIETLNPRPMREVVSAQRVPVQNTDCVNVSMISWGADESAVYAFDQGLFNHCVELFRIDDFKQATERVIGGYTPYLRCTMGMCVSAMEALAGQGIEMVAIYQHSWSVGGDTMVCRNDMVKKPSDLRGKRIGLQLYGPHMLIVHTVLTDGGLTVNDVELVWYRELTEAPYNVPGGVAVNPVDAMFRDGTLACVMVISPDMMTLTAGGGVGTGGESVKNAEMIFSTKTADKIIADLYLVRKDYYEAHRDKVENFVHGLLIGQEKQKELFNNKDQRSQEYNEFVTKAAAILRDNPQAIADVEGMYADMRFAGFRGNVEFFTSENEFHRTFDRVKTDAEEALMAFGLISGPVQIEKAVWDWNAMAVGLSDTQGVEIPKFDSAQVARVIESRQRQALANRQAGGSGDVEGVVLNFSVDFAPNQSEFSVDQYSEQFAKVVDWASKYTGAIISIEGHADPLGYYIALHGVPEKNILPQTPEQAEKVRQAAKNTSLQRALSVRDEVIAYASEQGVTLDPSRFGVSGIGVDRPLYDPPFTKEQWAANRRVTFQMLRVEGEIDQFIFVGQ